MLFSLSLDGQSGLNRGTSNIENISVRGCAPWQPEQKRRESGHWGQQSVVYFDTCIPPANRLLDMFQHPGQHTVGAGEGVSAPRTDGLQWEPCREILDFYSQCNPDARNHPTGTSPLCECFKAWGDLKSFQMFQCRLIFKLHLLTIWVQLKQKQDHWLGENSDY